MKYQIEVNGTTKSYTLEELDSIESQIKEIKKREHEKTKMDFNVNYDKTYSQAEPSWL